MKKNLKIVSAAAAALLAVAPVAASAIPVGAANSTPISVTPGPSTPSNPASTSLNLKLNVNNASSLRGGENVDQISTSLTTDVGTARLGNNGKAYVIEKSVYDELSNKSQTNVANHAVTKFESGKTYVVVAFNITVSGLNSDVTVPENGYFDKIAGIYSTNQPLVSDSFSISDSNIEGVPYYTKKGKTTTINSLKIKLQNNNVKDLLDAITNQIDVHGGSDSNTEVSSTTQDDLAIQLADKGISVNENNNFSAPANTFTVHYDTKFINGEVARLNVTVTPANSSLGTQRTVTQSTPTVTIDGNEIESTGNEVKKGKKVTTYGTTSVNGTTYYRLDNGEFVEANAFKAIKPSKSSKQKTRRLRLKKNAYIYNKNHKRVGRTVYKKNSAHNVYANNKGAEWYNLNDGTVAYQLSDGRYKGDYIDVRNFGVKVSTPKKTRRARTTYKKARVRSRVFYASGKAVRRTYIGKNARVRIYGTKRIHGQNYYYLGGRRYVKANNFR